METLSGFVSDIPSTFRRTPESIYNNQLHHRHAKDVSKRRCDLKMHPIPIHISDVVLYSEIREDLIRGP